MRNKQKREASVWMSPSFVCILASVLGAFAAESFHMGNRGFTLRGGSPVLVIDRAGGGAVGVQFSSASVNLGLLFVDNTDGKLKYINQKVDPNAKLGVTTQDYLNSYSSLAELASAIKAIW